ncbi:MAG: restriction endonuclease [Bacteroidetes bacterium]|nr:restriction endonuclease [Bacteroidota bacterium]
MINGTLYPTEFLNNGIRRHSEYQALHDASMQALWAELEAIFARFPTQQEPIEATTEADLIEPVLHALGWHHYLTQQTTSQRGRSNVPDYLLFEDDKAKDKANKRKNQHERYIDGQAILEAKAWLVPLDRRNPKQDSHYIPSNQILRYLADAETESKDKIRWGILTNGRLWRLYYQRAQSRSEQYLELDLGRLMNVPGLQATLGQLEQAAPLHLLRIFVLLFGRPAFVPGAGGETYHERALAEGKRWEAQVAEDLRRLVFDQGFPQLMDALWAADPKKPEHPSEAYLAELRQNALLLLYRLLFILYAEDRDLLPVRHEGYLHYSLRGIREEVAKRIDQNEVLSKIGDTFYGKMKALFMAIDRGDEALAVPPYNGGLFAEGEAALLGRARMPDRDFARVLDLLSRHKAEGERPKWINYRDLSVQQLGSIYEGLLEFWPQLQPDGRMGLQPNIYARKTSGSYYTPDELVQLSLQKTVGILVDERRQAFASLWAQLQPKKGKDWTPAAKHLKAAEKDPAEAILRLKICDPAMGSGHFLVSLVDYLADQVLLAMDEAEALAEGYQSPLRARADTIRQHILQQAQQQHWYIDEAQLELRQMVRRMVLKRCIYGLDKNPMAVELAKVSLWLHTFTMGAPLSFLDHHLRHGDSLFGEFVGAAQRELQQGGLLFLNQALQAAKPSAQAMAQIEQLTDADLDEVHQSARHYQRVRQLTHELDSFLQLYHAWKWLIAEDKKTAKARTTLWNQYLQEDFGPLMPLATGQAEPQAANQRVTATEVQAFASLLLQARHLATTEAFTNWQVAFPLVWDSWASAQPQGGYDAVVGNPPWDRIKLQQIEWFAARRPEIARQARAADRKRMIAQLEKNKDPLWQAYSEADRRTATMGILARENPEYPLLASGDINLYYLFVERAHYLIKPGGVVGLIVPSGIAADKTAAPFFQSITTTGRLAYLFDFENKKHFFPEVHASFKFCLYVAGGPERTFAQASLAFFLHRAAQIDEAAFSLTAEDFRQVNPNTGTAPIFRSRQDAELTRRIYQRLPVLHHHQKGKVWPVKYATMFHMTNDSQLFRTEAELEAEGYYPVDLGHWKRGTDLYLPLYEGKSIHHYNHRNAAIKVNPENLHNQALAVHSTAAQLAQPHYHPRPQYYIPASAHPLLAQHRYFLGFRDIARATDERTVLATLIPRAGVGNTLPILLPEDELDPVYLLCFSANFSSFVFDFVARQKMQSTHLSYYVLEQLPVIPPETYEQPLGSTTVGAWVQQQVLRLCYTAWDLQPLAQDLGYTGPPYAWDQEDRTHRMARLDALYFLLYGLAEDEVRYVLGTFPIVRRKDQEQHGHYRTERLILAYMRALRAGDTEVVVRG